MEEDKAPMRVGRLLRQRENNLQLRMKELLQGGYLVGPLRGKGRTPHWLVSVLPGWPVFQIMIDFIFPITSYREILKGIHNSVMLGRAFEDNEDKRMANVKPVVDEYQEKQLRRSPRLNAETPGDKHIPETIPMQ